MADPIPTLEEVTITASTEVGFNENTAYEYVMKAAGILSSENLSTDILNLIIEMNIYQDIYSGVVTGDALVLDNMDLIYDLKMCGNEYFAIQYCQLLDPESTIEKVFRIYKISDRKDIGITSNSYRIHFCSDVQLISDATVINKAYLGKKNSEIVEDILTEYLRIPTNRLEVESTDDTFDHIIPNMRPLQAINWLSGKSYSRNINAYCYFFYEKLELDNKISKFYFKSLQSMFNKEPELTLNLASSKIIDLSIPRYEKTITKLHIMDEFDVLRTTSTGGFASRITGIDTFNQNWNVYEKSLEEQKDYLMNKHLPINKLIERNDKTLLESYDALDLYYHEIKDNPTAKDNNIEFILNRAQSLSALNNFRLKLIIPGIMYYNVGDTIKIEFPTFRATIYDGESSGEKEYNEYRGTKEDSGKFLITSIRHSFKGNLYETIMELCSDSYAAELPAANKITSVDY